MIGTSEISNVLPDTATQGERQSCQRNRWTIPYDDRFDRTADLAAT
jgi:hypothetical protein